MVEAVIGTASRTKACGSAFKTRFQADSSDITMTRVIGDLTARANDMMTGSIS